MRDINRKLLVSINFELDGLIKYSKISTSLSLNILKGYIWIEYACMFKEQIAFALKL